MNKNMRENKDKIKLMNVIFEDELVFEGVNQSYMLSHQAVPKANLLPHLASCVRDSGKDARKRLQEKLKKRKEKKSEEESSS